ncbi:MAG: hypothetical protein AB7H66_13400 [Hyphomonadaceae bacterium]
MSGFGTDDVIEWRPSPGWALKWLALHLFVLLPFLGMAALATANSIAGAPEGTWPAYLFFLGAFATLVLGTLMIAVLAGVVMHARLIFDKRPLVQADRYGLQVRRPLKPLRTVRWQDIGSIEIERTRRQGRILYVLNHILVVLQDGAGPELSIKPQMAGRTLEEAHTKLDALWSRFR